MNYFNKLNESVRKKFKINDQFLNKYDLTEKLMKVYKRVSKDS
jgi:hypothetical protein